MEAPNTTRAALQDPDSGMGAAAAEVRAAPTFGLSPLDQVSTVPLLAAQRSGQRQVKMSIHGYSVWQKLPRCLHRNLTLSGGPLLFPVAWVRATVCVHARVPADCHLEHAMICRAGQA